MGYSPRGHRESDTTERVPTSLSTSVSYPVLVNFLFISFFSLFGRVVKCSLTILQELFTGKERDLLPTWHTLRFSFCCLLRQFWFHGMRQSFFFSHSRKNSQRHHVFYCFYDSVVTHTPSSSVTEIKSVCPMHSGDGQAEVLEFGAERAFLKGHARRQVSCAFKS